MDEMCCECGNGGLTGERVLIKRLRWELVSSTPFGDCTGDGLLGCSLGCRLANLLPCLWARCGRAQSRRTLKTTRDRLRIFRLGQRSSGLAAFTSPMATAVRDTPSGGVDLRCAEHQAEICILSAPARDRSKTATGESGSIHSDGVSWDFSWVAVNGICRLPSDARLHLL